LAGLLHFRRAGEALGSPEEGKSTTEVINRG
jgi:hypothetical protein